MRTYRIFLLALGVFLLDQGTKSLAKHYFSVTTNTGAAFGILQGWNAVLIVIGILAILFFCLYLRRHRLWPLGLLLGGTLGNVVDRLVFGHVIDFIDVGFWPSFNIADAANTLGVLLLLWIWRKS